MTTLEIANDIAALCRAGKNLDAVKKHYASDVVSHEVNDPMKLTKGVEGVAAKNQWWTDNHEVHERKVDGPWPNGDQFALRHTFTITPKATGKKVVMDEIAVYTVKNGKVAEEKFYYAT